MKTTRKPLTPYDQARMDGVNAWINGKGFDDCPYRVEEDGLTCREDELRQGWLKGLRDAALAEL